MNSMERKVHVEEDIKERAEENWDFHFPVVNQQFCLLSIVDTESKDTCAAVKIFGCYPPKNQLTSPRRRYLRSVIFSMFMSVLPAPGYPYPLMQR